LKGYDAVAYFDLNKENRIKSRFGMKFLNPGDSLVEATLRIFCTETGASFIRMRGQRL
jgi:hypothetical protein